MIDQKPFKVIIIGAGLAGSCLANGLMRHDIDVQVYERLPKDSKREGYQIRLGAAALRGMRACLSQAELDRIVQKFGRADGTTSQAPVVYNQHFDVVLDLSKFPTYDKSAPISRVVLRDALAEPVSNAGRLKYGAQFSRYEILSPGTPQERVRVWFQDGSSDVCDVLIAADGSHSMINKQIGLDNITQINDYVSMIAKNELPTKTYLQVDPRVSTKPILTFAEKKALYFCAYLPESMDESGLYDETLSSSFFGLHVPASQCPEGFSRLANEDKWKFVSQALKDWSKEYHEMIDLVKGCDLYVYQGRVSSQPPRNWRTKVRSASEPERGHHRVWLVGDAIHAMLPNRGMGGNTAISDTATALPLLVRLSQLKGSSTDTNPGDFAEACEKYEAEMIPRAFAWVRKSGGANIVPIDADTYQGRILFGLAAVLMNLAYYWYAFIGLFSSKHHIDDAPELR